MPTPKSFDVGNFLLFFAMESRFLLLGNHFHYFLNAYTNNGVEKAGNDERTKYMRETSPLFHDNIAPIPIFRSP